METKELLNKCGKDTSYVLDAFSYADQYADGLFMRGAGYGFAFGIIATLLIAAIVLNV